MSQYSYIPQFSKEFREAFINKKENRVAVLGSSEMWPLVHKICLDVVACGFVAVTSRYIYLPSINAKSGYRRAEQNHDRLKINDFIRDKVIDYCDSAIIVYAHHVTSYNEAEWCNERKIRTLGINFTRTIRGEGYCEDCIVDEGAGFSYCCEESNTEICVTKKPCPIKTSGISKTQLDYFLPRNETMNLISMEKPDKTLDIVNAFLSNRLNLPNKLVHVFEFRVDISKEEYEKIDQKLKNFSKENEDRSIFAHEYIDYYYKPVNTTVEEWLSKKQSLRIRQFLSQVKECPLGSVYYSQVEQTEEGFYYKQPFGGVSWFEGNLNTAQEWLQEMGMECFLKTIKKGKNAQIHQQKIYDTKFKVFIEEIEVEQPSVVTQLYGHSLEVEVWTDKPQDMEKIRQKKQEILKHLELEDCHQKLEPVQEFTYNFLAKHLNT